MASVRQKSTEIGAFFVYENKSINREWPSRHSRLIWTKLNIEPIFKPLICILLAAYPRQE